MASKCPAGCGRKFISDNAAEVHADAEHDDWRTPKQKGWCTPYGFGDWSYPITYAQACAEMKTMYDKVAYKFEEHKNAGRT